MHSACPASWKAVSVFSSSVITIERRSAPIMTLSLACSNSAIETERLPRRAAISAASLTRLARSAPEKPGVPRAMIRASTSEASGTLRIWTLRIFSRPTTSGFGTTTWRSNRPGRSSAGSSTSGRLVAAMMMTPLEVSNPSISTSSWLRVCSGPGLADGVQLVQEHEAGGLLLGLVEQLPDPGRAQADEHLHELRAGHEE